MLGFQQMKKLPTCGRPGRLVGRQEPELIACFGEPPRERQQLEQEQPRRLVVRRRADDGFLKRHRLVESAVRECVLGSHGA